MDVPPGLPHVYSVNGRYLTRTGAQNRLLSATELSALLLARDEAGFESRPVPDVTLDDLDPVQVQGYLELCWEEGSRCRASLANDWPRPRLLDPGR